MDASAPRRESAGMSENITEKSRVRRLERSRSDRMVAGVCEGLARYFNLSPVLYRVGFVVLTLLGGAGILIYAAAALVIPEEGRADSIAAEVLRRRRERPWPLVGLALVATAGVVLLSRATLWPRGDAAWVLVLLAGGVILWTQHRRNREAVDTAVAGRERRSLRRPLSIVAAVAAVLVLGFAAAVATAFHVDVRNGVGDRIYQPAGAADVHRHYRLGIGELRLDLRDVRPPVGETALDARVGIGDLSVTVPSDVALQVRASAQVGAVHVFGREVDGRNARVRVGDSGARVLVLNARVGLGNVRVTRSLR